MSIFATLNQTIKKEESRPAWARGLKRGYLDSLWSQPEVAPHMGAWIETLTLQILENKKLSHPHI